MAQEFKNKQVDSNDQLNVESIGDAWIVCKSKSHPSRTYYFNTLSGNSVWNLDKSEIAKAEKATKRIEKQHGVPIELYLNINEPLMAPGHYNSVNSVKKNPGHDLLLHLVSNQVQNATFSSQSYTNQSTNYNLVNPPNEQILKVPIANYNSNVWAMPNNQQMFINTSSSHCRQNLDTTNVFEQNAQNTIPLDCRFTIINKLQNPHKDKYESTFWHKKKDSRFKKDFFHSRVKKEINQNHVDLREKLKAREKRFSQGNISTNALNSDDQITLVSKNISSQHTKPFARERRFSQGNISTNALNSDDQTTLVNKNISSQHTKPFARERRFSQGNISTNALNSDDQTTLVSKNISSQHTKPFDKNNEKGDATDVKSNFSVADCLNSLRKPNTVKSKWYMVVDTDMFLHETNLLDRIFEADKECIMVVPELVMAQLRVGFLYTTPELKSLAQSGVQYITDKIKACKAVIDKNENLSDIKEDICNHIISCCQRLVEQKYHTILISNRNYIKERAKAKEITLLNVEEIKELVNKHKNANKNNCKSTSDSCKNIKIIVPNDTQMRKEPLIATTEAGVQTDEIFIDDAASKIKHNYLTTTKRREIILNRDPNNDPKLKKVERKPLRWRRKRNFNEQRNSETINIILEKQNTDHLHATSNANYQEDTKSDTSSCVIYNKQSADNIVIEETSSSAIISNTASNADDESVHSLITSYPNSTKLKDIDQKDEVVIKQYDITNTNMETNLRIKCDEWVSMFCLIMEDVLTQILLGLPLSKNSALPPWTLWEAIECIHNEYDQNFNVKLAAKYLLKSLLSVSDDKGKIKMPMQPTAFMQMYSCGVHLLKTLQDSCEINSAENIEMAIKSLFKLLSDINNDYQNESTEESSAIASVINSPSKCKDNYSKTEKSKSSSPAQAQRGVRYSRRLMNIRKDTPEKKSAQSDKVQKNTYIVDKDIDNLKINTDDVEDNNSDEDNFFHSLNLCKRNDLNETFESDSDSVRSPMVKKDTSKKIPNETSIDNSAQQNMQDNNHIIIKHNVSPNKLEKHNYSDEFQSETTENNSCNNNIVNQKVVPTFRKLDEFEELLKKQQNKVYYKDNYYSDDYKSDTMSEEVDGDENYLNVSYYETNQNIKQLYNEICYELKIGLLSMHKFCDNTFQELQGYGGLNENLKKSIKKKVEALSFVAHRLDRTLNSVARIPDSGIAAILNDEFTDYGRELTKLCNQTNIMLETLRLILLTINT